MASLLGADGSATEPALGGETQMRAFAFVTGLIVLGLGSAGAAGAMTVTSAEIKPGAKIPNEQVANLFGCTSPNVSPSLAWTGAPKGTKSFAVSMYDPDAPTGSGFWHWWVVNIPADATSLPKGAGGGTGLPAGAMQGRNDFSINSYGGPCPPPGKPHRYVITVFALDTDKIDIDANTSPAVIGFNANGHTLAKATLTGLYGR
jgi:Raf kinase inhibitor-like YbhB/YbcL family protein